MAKLTSTTAGWKHGSPSSELAVETATSTVSTTCGEARSTRHVVTTHPLRSTDSAADPPAPEHVKRTGESGEEKESTDSCRCRWTRKDGIGGQPSVTSI